MRCSVCLNEVQKRKRKRFEGMVEDVYFYGPPFRTLSGMGTAQTAFSHTPYNHYHDGNLREVTEVIRPAVMDRG